MFKGHAVGRTALSALAFRIIAKKSILNQRRGHHFPGEVKDVDPHYFLSDKLLAHKVIEWESSEKNFFGYLLNKVDERLASVKEGKYSFNTFCDAYRSSLAFDYPEFEVFIAKNEAFFRSNLYVFHEAVSAIMLESVRMAMRVKLLVLPPEEVNVHGILNDLTAEDLHRSLRLILQKFGNRVFKSADDVSALRQEIKLFEDEEIAKETAKKKTQLDYQLYDEFLTFYKQLPEKATELSPDKVLEFIDKIASNYNLSRKEKREFAIKTVMGLKYHPSNPVNRVSNVEEVTSSVFAGYKISEDDPAVKDFQQVFNALVQDSRSWRIFWGINVKDLPEVFKLVKFLNIGANAPVDDYDPKADFASQVSFGYLGGLIPTALEEIRLKNAQGSIPLATWWRALELDEKLLPQVKSYDNVRSVDMANSDRISDSTKNAAFAFITALYSRLVEEYREVFGGDPDSGKSLNKYGADRTNSNLRSDAYRRSQLDGWYEVSDFDYLGECVTSEYKGRAIAISFQNDKDNEVARGAFKGMITTQLWDKREVGVQILVDKRYICTIEPKKTPQEKKNEVVESLMATKLTPCQLMTVCTLRNDFDSFLPIDFGFSRDRSRSRVEIETIDGSDNVILRSVEACVPHQTENVKDSTIFDDTGVRIVHECILRPDGTLKHSKLKIIRERAFHDQEMTMFASFAKAKKSSNKSYVRLAPGFGQRLESVNKPTVKENSDVRWRLLSCVRGHFSGVLPKSLRSKMDGFVNIKAPLSAEEIGQIMAIVKQEDLKNKGWLDQEIEKYAKRLGAIGKPLTEKDINLFFAQANGWFDLDVNERKVFQDKLTAACANEIKRKDEPPVENISNDDNINDNVIRSSEE